MKKNRQKPAAGFNPLYDHNHVISDWFPYKSDIAAHAREKAAQNLRLHFIRIRHCDECICRWVWSFAQLGCSRRSRNIFWNVAYTTVLKETSSLLRFHFQRRSLSCRSKLIQVARWPLGLPPRFGCPLVWLSSFGLSFGHGEAKEWRLSVFKVFCMSNVSEFVSSHIKTTGHSDVFVWNGVWVFAQLLSHLSAAMSLLYGNLWFGSYIWLTYTKCHIMLHN